MLAQRVAGLAPKTAARRLILLEPRLDTSFGINLLDCRQPVDADDDPEGWAVDSTVAAVKKLYGDDSSYQPTLERYLPLALRTLLPSGGTLLDVPTLFRDRTVRGRRLQAVSAEETFVHGEWAAFDRLPLVEQERQVQSLTNRLGNLRHSRVMTRIVGSRRTTVPFNAVLDGQDILILSIPSERLTRERCDFIGALFLCAFADRAFARAVSQTPPPVHLYLDEYQRFATSTMTELLTQGRKFGVGLTAAYQGLTQISDERVREGGRLAGTLILGRLTRPDADDLAGELPITPKAEWAEETEAVDGTEPELVPTRRPIEHLQQNGHRNPEVAAAARGNGARVW